MSGQNEAEEKRLQVPLSWKSATMKKFLRDWWLTVIGALVMFAVSLAYLALQPELQLVESETTFVHH